MNLKLISFTLFLCIGGFGRQVYACEGSVYVLGKVNRHRVYSYLTKNLSIPAVEGCISKGVGINDEIWCGETYLHLAVNSGNLDVTQFILSHPEFNKDSINRPQNGRLYPIYSATSNNHIEILSLLLKNGANPNVKSLDGLETPLHTVKSLQAAEILVAAGAQVNEPNRWGQTPVYFVKSNAVLRYLKERGAVIDTKDFSGKSPLKYRFSTTDHLETLVGYLREKAPLLSNNPEREISELLSEVSPEELIYSNRYRAVLQSTYIHLAEGLKLKASGLVSHPRFSIIQGLELIDHHFSHLHEVERLALIELYTNIYSRHLKPLTRDELYRERLTRIRVAVANSTHKSTLPEKLYCVRNFDQLLVKLQTAGLILIFP